MKSTAIPIALALFSVGLAARADTLIPLSAPVETGQPLTLEQSIALALRLNGSTLAANRSFEAASQNVRSVKSGLTPQVSANLGYSYINETGGTVTTVPGGTTGNGTTFRSNGGITTTGVSVSQNIFDSGRVRTLIRGAQANAVGAAGNVGSARNALAWTVAQRYYEQLRQTRLVVQRRAQIQLAQSQLNLVQAQFTAGTVARSDIQSVQVNVSQAKLDLSTAQNDLRVAQTTFRNSLGLNRGPALELQDDFPAAVLPTSLDLNVTDTTASAILPPITTPKLDELDDYVARADRLRPDIVQAQAQVQNAQSNVKLAKIDARPQISATAGYEIDPRSTGTRGFTLSGGLSIPLFNGGGLRAAVKSADANLDAAQIQLDQTRKDVAADVEASYTDLQGQSERLANAQSLVEQATTNLANAVAKYKAGAGIILDIVNAQTQLFSAQNSFTGVLYDAQVSRLDLDRATGRFAWANPDQNAPTSAPTTLPGATAALASLAIPAATTPLTTSAPTGSVTATPSTDTPSSPANQTRTPSASSPTPTGANPTP